MKIGKLLLPFFLMLSTFTIYAQETINKQKEEVLFVNFREGSFSETIKVTFDIEDDKIINGLSKKDLEKKFEKEKSFNNVVSFILKDGYTFYQAIPITGGSGFGSSRGTAKYTFVFKKAIPDQK